MPLFADIHIKFSEKINNLVSEEEFKILVEGIQDAIKKVLGEKEDEIVVAFHMIAICNDCREAEATDFDNIPEEE